MATVETTAGPLAGADLGFTLSHEHIAMQPANIGRHYPWLVDRDAIRSRAIRELTEAKAGGVDTIIELSTPDLERDVALIAQVANASGMQVVVATGLWRDIPRYFWTRSPEEIADVFVHEIEVGIADTGIKAGVIKVANDAEGVTPQAELVLRGAAQASRRTGCPISTHHWAPKEVGRRQVEVFQEENAPMDRVCIGHSADSTDADYLEDLLNAGVFLSMDRYPGADGRPNWQQRNTTVKELIDRGWAGKLMLGHDYAPGLHPEESPTRYLFLSTVALPALRKDGVPQETIDLMMRDVPRHFLTGES
ncbi:MAG: phosphotriesterase-related protein [Chloroflexi bacterium]|nr:phosphotriesterase-related protein [Chloroflexota bacterium]